MRRATLVGLVLMAAAFVALLGVSLTSAVEYYRTPTELLASTDTTGTVRLYGIVVPGSVAFDRPQSRLSFRLTDGTTTVVVETSALPTALFRDGVGVVVSGRLGPARTFVADEILVKHSEVYEPVRPGETIPPNLLDELPSTAP